MRRAGDAVSKADILHHVWDANYDGDANVVEVYVGYLRRKIDTPFGRQSVQTVRGAGYRLTRRAAHADRPAADWPLRTLAGSALVGRQSLRRRLTLLATALFTFAVVTGAPAGRRVAALRPGPGAGPVCAATTARDVANQVRGRQDRQHGAADEQRRQRRAGRQRVRHGDRHLAGRHSARPGARHPSSSPTRATVGDSTWTHRRRGTSLARSRPQGRSATRCW